MNLNLNKLKVPSEENLQKLINLMVAMKSNSDIDLADYVTNEELTTTLEDYVLDSDMEIIDLATLESMLELSTEELEGLAQIIDDSQIVLNKTYSSSKIYSSIAQCLEDSKAYTLSELSKAISASYKVVTSVDQMTDSKVLYLLKDADSGMYNIYVFDEDTTSAELIGSFEINLDDFYTKTESEDLFVTKADVVANYATKQEVVDSYATKTELQDAIADVEVEISETENNQIQTLEDGLFVDSETVTISKADYDALSDEEKNNGKTYFVPDDETTEDGTDLTQFAKISDLEETNSKIEEINDSLAKSIITFTPNSEYVVTNYTYCRKSGNIVILNVDMTYNVDTQYTEYVMGAIDSDFPESTVFNIILNGDGGKIQLYVRPNGEVMIETGDSTVGINSRVRYQVMWIV